MNTDNPDEVIDMSERESGDGYGLSGKQKGPEPRVVRRIASFLIFGSIIGAWLFVYIWVANPFAAQTSDCGIGGSACGGMLHTINDTVVWYNHEEGAYPATIEELVPDYLGEIPEDWGCMYSLDTSTTPPTARCSIHGTVETWGEDLEKNKQNSRSVTFIVVIAIFVFCLIIGVFLWIKSDRKLNG